MSPRLAPPRWAYLVEADHLAVRLLHFAQPAEEVPEARLGHHVVRGEDAHAVELRRRVGVGRQMPPDDLVFLKTTWRNCQSILKSW